MPVLPLRLGPFPVRTDAAAVRDFAVVIASDGQPRQTPIPHTFPICWLSDQPILDAIIACCASDIVLVQSLQMFTYHRSLQIDAAYTLTIDLSSTGKSGSDLWLDARVTDGGGGLILEMRTGLLQVPGFASGAAR